MESTIPMMVIMFAILYFMMIRPQQKEQKAHAELLSSLQKGHRVVTSSGLHGKVWEVRPTEVALEVSDKVRITVDKLAIKRRLESGEPAKEQ